MLFWWVSILLRDKWLSCFHEKNSSQQKCFCKSDMERLDIFLYEAMLAEICQITWKALDITETLFWRRYVKQYERLSKLFSSIRTTVFLTPPTAIKKCCKHKCQQNRAHSVYSHKNPFIHNSWLFHAKENNCQIPSSYNFVQCCLLKVIIGFTANLAYLVVNLYCPISWVSKWWTAPTVLQDTNRS